MLCSYGCGKESIHIFNNGKSCCSISYQSCPEVRLKNALSNTGGKDRNPEHNENKTKIPCRFCNRITSTTGIKSHEKYCYLNPDNRRDCPVCGKPIKNFKVNKTCSTRCGTIISRNRDCNEKNNSSENSYRLICFKYHGEQCILCGEELMLEVHHLDGNRSNNSPENIIPLCPTHHSYCHHCEHWFIIKECVDDYMEKFKRSKE